MLKQRILPQKHLWWKEPAPRKPAKTVGKRKRAQEVDDSISLRKLMKVSLPFAISRRWVRYVDLPSVDRGYITEIYNLRSVQTRYGLSQSTARYWRQHILPEPLTIATMKNVRAFYWSRIQLSVMDAVLRWQESQGLLTIRKTDYDLLELIDNGCAELEAYYAERYEDQSLMGEKPPLGVRFID